VVGRILGGGGGGLPLEWTTPLRWSDGGLLLLPFLDNDWDGGVGLILLFFL
jgi:hypothetical protein